MYRELLRRACELRNGLPEISPRKLQDIPSRFRLFDDGLVSVIYAPVDYINREARVVVLGITPGWHQVRLAIETGVAMRGAPGDVVGREIKQQSAFAGTMRRSLITMLDELAIHELLDIDSTAELFTQRMDLVHSTSALRYPVFKNGANYSGYNPKPFEHPFLVAMLEELLAPELASIPGALIIPLGKAVEDTLEYLTERKVLSSAQWLHGFPHPSGANGHRKRLFELQKVEMAGAARRWLSRPT